MNRNRLREEQAGPQAWTRLEGLVYALGVAAAMAALWAHFAVLILERQGLL